MDYESDSRWAQLASAWARLRTRPFALWHVATAALVGAVVAPTCWYVLSARDVGPEVRTGSKINVIASSNHYLPAALHSCEVVSIREPWVCVWPGRWTDDAHDSHWERTGGGSGPYDPPFWINFRTVE